MRKFLPLTLSLLALIVLIGAYSFMYAGTLDGVNRTEASLLRTESLSSRDALIRSQQVFLENVIEERALLETYVASEAQVIEIIEIVENTADEEEVTLAISTVNTVSVDGWQAHEGVVVNFSASGTFSEMMRFIAALESLPIGSKLERASLELSSDEGWFGTFSIMFVKMK